jgi:nucleoside-diphosphate-sugar epimerase|tara:strand:+ start:1183 stop:2130 length:948 start_codon:yes stop_codon:yes gene_type:complete
LKRAIITGATGFVGANLARHLLDAGCQVHLLVRPQYASWRIEDIRTDVQIHVLDLLDTASLECVLKDVRPDWIFHLAVYGAYSAQRELPQMIATNITATANLLHASLNVGFESFVNTGSSSEYGIKQHAANEFDSLDPNSYYACTKAAATHLCRHLARERDADITTLRLYSAYGPYEEPTRLIPTLALAALRGQLPPLVSPQTARDFVYVEDVCRAYLLAASRPQAERGAIYNVGSGVQTTLEEAVRQVREICQIDTLPQWGSMPNRQWDAQTWVADATKIERELGWEPECDFAEGFHRTMAWFSAHEHLLSSND